MIQFDLSDDTPVYVISVAAQLSGLHAQTLLTVTYDGQLLPPKYGFPMKVRMPRRQLRTHGAWLR